MKQRTIAILDPASFIGGAERFVVDFARHASANPAVRIVVISNDNEDYRKLLPREIIHYPLALPPLRLREGKALLHSIAKMIGILRREQATVLLGNSVRANIIASVAGWWTETPVIWMLHEYTFQRAVFLLLSWIPVAMIAVSGSVKNAYLPYRLTKRTKILCIPNGIDFNEAQERSRQPIDRRIGMKRTGEHWIGIIGRIEPWKGQMEFLDVAEHIARSSPNVRFFICGEAPTHDATASRYEQQVRERMRQGPLRDRVTMATLGNVFPLLSQLDILLHCSTEPEPFGRVIIEAMACGATVIASPAGGPAEIITHERNGYLVNARDIAGRAKRISDLLSTPRVRREIGQRAQETVRERFALDVVTREILEVLPE